MKFSIITACYNDAAALEKTIESVARQVYADREYIIIDGQSTDDTQNLVKKYMEAGVVQTLVSEPDLGVYDAMNKGVARAAGDFVYFLNANDGLADPQVLEDVAAALSARPDCDLLYGDINLVAQRDGSLTRVTYPEPNQILDHLMFGWVCHQAMFTKTELFHQLGPFDLELRIAADYDWLFRALERPIQLLHLPRLIATYTLGGLSDTDQVRSLTEMFAVQQRFPAYQNPEALQRRVGKLQDVILQLKAQEQRRQAQSPDPTPEVQQLKAQVRETRSQLKTVRQRLTQTRDHLTETEARLEAVTAELAAMKTSKFWKLRSLWFEWKRSLKLLSSKSN